MSFLFWKNKTALEDVLGQFREDLRDKAVSGDRLVHLVDLLADIVKLVKENPGAYRTERKSTSATGPFVDETQFVETEHGAATSLIRNSISPAKPGRSPTSLRQSTLSGWTSNKLGVHEVKDDHQFAIPPIPWIPLNPPIPPNPLNPPKPLRNTQKRKSDDDLLDPAKFARLKGGTRPVSRTSFNTSLGYSASTIPSGRTSFSTNTANQSFASTVATSISSEDEACSGSNYGDLDSSQAENLLRSFDTFPMQPSADAGLKQVSNFAMDISASQKTQEDSEFEAPEPLHRVHGASAEAADAQLQAEHAAHFAAAAEILPTPVKSLRSAKDNLYLHSAPRPKATVTSHEVERKSSSLAKTPIKTIRPVKNGIWAPAQPQETPVPRSARKPQAPPVSEHHLVRNLPQHGLFSEKLPSRMDSLPFALRWESARVAKALSMNLEDLSAHLPCHENDLYEMLKSTIGKTKPFNRTPASAWEASQVPERSSVVYKGKLTYAMGTSRREHMYALDLQPLQCEHTSRLLRAFGSHRFMFLDVPNISKLPSEFRDQTGSFRQRFSEWLVTEKDFLGCIWRAFHIQPIKGMSMSKKNREEAGGYRVVLFATSGPGLKLVSLHHLLDWTISLEENVRQPFCKAFARLDLSLSSTIPTVRFMPSQVRSVKDVKANGIAEDTAFNDAALKFISCHSPFRPKAMNDGCSLMSVGAAKEICDTIGLTGIRPVTFQGRINGCKGMWSISAPYDTSEARHQDVWIEINESQRKVIPRASDLRDSTCDKDRWTFELVKFGKPPSVSNLYLDFMPILEDRHVPRHVICSIVASQVEMDFEDLFNAIDEPTKLRQWVHSQRALLEEASREMGIKSVGAFPADTTEKVILLLESGFYAKDFAMLAKELTQFVYSWTCQLRAKLKVRLPKSTSVYGIADPTGCLKPGEVYLGFSETFRDESTGEAWSSLRGEVLVARHPSLRRSDIQKVKAVYKEELSHLRDVVVFPTQGCWPLADKLQGGDYDGDTFWLCWDSRLTSPFRNAPAPTSTADLKTFSIAVDERKLKDVLGVHQDVDAWLSQAFDFRLQEDMLGQVTNLHKRLAYRDNSICTPHVMAMADLHDLIIDSAKNGYTFDQKAFTNYKRKCKIKEPPKPAFEEQLNTSAAKGPRPSGLIKHNPNHIIDKVLFEVVNPKIESMQAKLKGILDSAHSNDPELAAMYLDRCESPDPVIGEVFEDLVKRTDVIVKRWNLTFNQNKDRNSPKFRLEADKCLLECYEEYRAINPYHANHASIQEWTKARVAQEPTTWDLLKASAFFFDRHMRRASAPTLIFHIAGRELCYIKTMSKPESRSMTLPMYSMLKPRKEKVARQTKEKLEPIRGEEEEESSEGDQEFFDVLE